MMIRWIRPQSWCYWSLVVLLWLLPGTVVSQDGEESKLRRFFEITSGTQWLNDTYWNTIEPICSWYGVTCRGNPQDREGVISIVLPANNLVGHVPKLIYTMPHLERLDLKDNPITHASFEGFTNLANPQTDVVAPLRYLSFANCALTDATGIGGAPDTLRELHLTDNRIDAFPTEVTQLTNLQKLFLNYNEMEGTLPTTIGQMTSLKEFYVLSNRLGGTIPTQVGALNRMEVFTIAENRITGSIPTQVNAMLNLKAFSAHNSNADSTGRLTGTLPTFENAPHLKTLFVTDNDLTGSIPRRFLQHNNNTDSLLTLGLANNQLTGKLPIELTRFELLDIDLTGNQITEIEDPICDAPGTSLAWMSGQFEQYGCDGIMCAPGYYNENGRQVADDQPCVPCAGATYFGSTSCPGGTSPTASPGGPGPVNGTTTPVAEVEILVQLYLTTGGAQWTENDGWTAIEEALFSSAGPGSVRLEPCVGNGWHGVDCNSDGNIQALVLAQNNLDGIIPAVVFQLPELTVADFSFNLVQMAPDAYETIGQTDNLLSLNMAGTDIPNVNGISAARDTLRVLFLGDVGFSGGIPEELFDLDNLRILHMQHCTFDGFPLPSEIGQLANLHDLNLYKSGLVGSLPSELGLLRDLHTLEMSENQFSGVLPPEFENLSNLEEFHIHQPNGTLTGPLPAMANWQNIRMVSFDSNSFSGTIPDNFMAAALATADLYIGLSNNDLTGSLPSSLENKQKVNINIEGNRLSSIGSAFCNLDDWMNGEVGAIKAAGGNGCDAIGCPVGHWNVYGKAGNTNNITCLNCGANTAFVGQTKCASPGTNLPPHGLFSEEREILNQLYLHTGGRYWTGEHVGWSDPTLPTCDREGIQCDADDNVEEISLEDYGLNGTVHPSIFLLPHLRRLQLSGNLIRLDLRSIGNATELKVLQMSRTRVRSLVGLGTAGDKLEEVHLAGCALDGTLPDDLFDASNIKKLFLGGNHISGTLPPDFIDMVSLEVLELPYNDLTGHIPSELGTLNQLTELKLQQNSLSGVLPASLNNLANLVTLDLSAQRGHLKLTGHLLEFTGTTSLKTLNLAENNLANGIPNSFLSGADTSMTINVNLSDNRLTGLIPATLDAFCCLNIDLSGNMITGGLSQPCDTKAGWMEGRVANLQCDAILCPPGTYAPLGMQLDGPNPCQHCAEATYFGSKDCPHTDTSSERALLQAFYDATGGPNWRENTNWDTETNICSWFGITCENGFVTKVLLENNQVAGESGVASIILLLPNLEELDLKGNPIDLDLTQIPPNSSLTWLRLSATNQRSLAGIGTASNLLRLHVTGCSMSGPIPAEVFTLTQLVSLYLSYNMFTGPLPAEIGNLQDLTELYLFGNSLTGTLPGDIWLLQELKELILSDNFFSGVLPDGLSQMPNLEQLSLYAQKGDELLTGPIPSFENTTKLWYFDASDNDMTGSIPNNFMENSVYVTEQVTVWLRNNDITGAVPQSLSRFETLDLDLTGNYIEDLPQTLCAEQGWMNGNVASFHCDAILCPPGKYSETGNQVNPSDPCIDCPRGTASAPYWGATNCDSAVSERSTLLQIYHQTDGPSWFSSENWDTDQPICSWEGVGCEDGDLQDDVGVTSLGLSANFMSGTLPDGVFTLPFLRRLDVSDNGGLYVSLEGIQRAKSLEMLQFSNVRLHSLRGLGSAPESLRDLHLSAIGWRGPIPTEVLQLTTLETLYMDHNFLTGPIPSDIARLTGLKKIFFFGNDLTSIPTEIGLLTDLETIIVAENLLNGPLPSQLSQLPNLVSFSAHRNVKSGPKITGSLPSFDRVPRLQNLFLEGNELTGPIPGNFLSSSLAMKLCYLGDNWLTGAVPASLGGITEVHLELKNNMITDVPGVLGDNADWMDGDVGSYGLDGFLCPPDRWSPIGRANGTVSCDHCSDPTGALMYYGSTNCDPHITERKILLDLFHACNGLNWYRRENWLSPENICDWEGVVCERPDGWIFEINLSANNLTGVIPTSIYRLPALKVLWLDSNPVAVNFAGIEKATNLLDLSIVQTWTRSLEGIGEAKSLTRLDARFNSIGTPFPQEIMELTNLRELNLAHNQLTGTIPASFDSMPYLHTLRLRNNELEGVLPLFLDMNVLDTIDLAGNSIGGTIPDAFIDRNDRRQLITIDLSGNQLHGAVPESLGKFNFATIYLRENRFTALPESLCQKHNWNDEEVGLYGCDAIMCPPGTANYNGRHSRESGPCVPCPGSTHFGETRCFGRNPFAAATSLSRLAATLVGALVTTWMLLL